MADTVDSALVHEVAAWAESRLLEPSSLEGLSELEADVLGTITAMGVIGNGGFAFWYEGKDRDQTLSVASRFQRMGLAVAAEAMRQSLFAFPDATPPQDLGDRQTYVSDQREELNARFDALDWTLPTDGGNRFSSSVSKVLPGGSLHARVASLDALALQPEPRTCRGSMLTSAITVAITVVLTWLGIPPAPISPAFGLP